MHLEAKRFSATYFRRSDDGAQQAGAQAGGADLLLLRLSVVGVFQQLDLVQNQRWKTLMRDGMQTQNQNQNAL